MFRKKEKTQDIAVVTEIKEPLTLNGFIESQIIDRWKKIKKLLDEKGIIYFITSPFQFKNRLILKIVIIIFGVILGVVPRTMHMVKDMRVKFAGSELSQVEGKTFSSGGLTVVPLASSRCGNNHAIVFDIPGSTMDGVSSITDDYQLSVSPLSGVSDTKGVRIYGKILPVNVNDRLFVVMADISKQHAHSAIYKFTVKAGGESVTMNVVLSEKQKTGDLIGEDGIDLSAISDTLVKNDSSEQDKIKTDEKALDKAVHTYANNEVRLIAIGDKVSPTIDELEEQVKTKEILTDIDDHSTTRKAAGIENVPNVAPNMDDGVVSLSFRLHNGDTDLETISSGNSSGSSGRSVGEGDALSAKDEDIQASQAYKEDLPSVLSTYQDVGKALTTLNEDRMKKWQDLYQLSDTLDKKITITDMKGYPLKEQ
jgi:hypothetical protein